MIGELHQFCRLIASELPVINKLILCAKLALDIACSLDQQLATNRHETLSNQS